MTSEITLTIVEGWNKGKCFHVATRRRLIVGRDPDCDIVLTGEDGGGVSRQHCLLVCEPPSASVRDLGSRNGTYVNGECIGIRSREERPAINELDDFANLDLHDGDEIHIGHVILRVAVKDDAATLQSV
jgi:eukaryotic-like serine/threonine-protein kinase